MRLTIKHHTRYRYEEAAAAAIQVLRLTPRNHDGQAIRHWRVEIDADCKLDRDEDAFGNVTHTFSIDGPVSEVNVRVEGMVETSDTDGKVEGTRERFPPGFWLRRSALTMPSREIEVLAENIKRFGHKNVTYIGSIDTATDRVIDALEPGDLVITLGAGSVTRLSDEIYEKLKEREARGKS